jgi:hypothetical protein
MELEKKPTSILSDDEKESKKKKDERKKSANVGIRTRDLPENEGATTFDSTETNTLKKPRKRF